MSECPIGWQAVTYGDVLAETHEKRHGRTDLPVLSVTKNRGIMLASERFGKPLHGRDLTKYRVATRGTIVADPMLLWDGAIGQQLVVDAGVVSPDYRVYEPSAQLASDYIRFVVGDPRMRRHYQGGARGTNVRRNRIARSDFLRIPLMLPPLPEQRKIAAILSAVDEVIEKTEAVIESLQTLKKAMMHELLTRGLPGRHTRFKQTEIGKIPDEWEVVQLLEVANLPSGQVDPRVEPYRQWTLVAPNHVESATGRLLQRESAAQQRARSGKYTFEAGDVVYSKIRPYLCKAWLATFPGICSADMYPLRSHKKIQPGYLLATVLSQRFTDFTASVSMRTGIPKINREELSEYSFALPPVREQEQIARALAAADHRLAAEGKALQSSQALKGALLSVLLTGELRVKPDEEHYA